jgi:hypothetical protein
MLGLFVGVWNSVGPLFAGADSPLQEAVAIKGKVPMLRHCNAK